MRAMRLHERFAGGNGILVGLRRLWRGVHPGLIDKRHALSWRGVSGWVLRCRMGRAILLVADAVVNSVSCGRIAAVGATGIGSGEDYCWI